MNSASTIPMSKRRTLWPTRTAPSMASWTRRPRRRNRGARHIAVVDAVHPAGFDGDGTAGIDEVLDGIGDPSASLPTSANWTMREREVEMPVVSVSKAKTRSPARGLRPCQRFLDPPSTSPLTAGSLPCAGMRHHALVETGRGLRGQEEEGGPAGRSLPHRRRTIRLRLRLDAVEAAGALLDGPTVGMKAEEAEATPTPEYDVGEVEADALLDDGPLEPSIDHSE